MAEKICGSILYIIGVIVITFGCTKQNICTSIVGSTWMICGTLLAKEGK